MAVALATWSAGVSAATLGRLTVQSALGQPLRAEVEVTSVSPDEAATLSARVASADAFRQAGLEYGPAMQSLRFAIERRGEARYVVRISSAQPINEPFVDLLLELRGGNGRFVREYTFLLDPPELRSVQPPAAAQAAQPEAVVPAQTPAAQGSVRPAPPRSADEPARAAAPRAVDETARTAAPRAEQPAERAAAGSADSTSRAHRVNRGETLDGLSRQFRPAEASVEQTAASIYRTNPAAFGRTPDQLKAGATLRIPDRDAIASLSPAEARRALRMRAEDFHGYRDRIAASPRQLESARGNQSAAGQIEAQVNDGSGAAGGRDQLRLSRSGAVDKRIAHDVALAEVDDRVRYLERTLADLQKLLEMKDRSLAGVQKQLDEARGAAAKPAAPASAGADAAAPADGKATPTVLHSAGAASPPAAAPAAPAAPAAAPSADGAAPSAPSVAAEGSKLVAMPTPTPPVETDGLAAALASDYALPALGGLALLGAGYAWLAVRRRRRAERFDDTLTGPDPLVENSMLGAPATRGGDSDGAASGLAPAVLDAHATEVDPIAEAEVYIAYGREQQAEDILREALRKQPERQPVRAKLMEIFFNRKDAVAFGELAGQMYLATEGRNEEWPQVAAWGRELDPDNPVYAFDAAAASVDHAQLPDADAQGDPFGTPVARLAGAADAAEPVPATQPTPAQIDQEIAPLDFELDLDTIVGRAGEHPPAAAAGSDGRPAADPARTPGADFELPSLDLGGTAETGDMRFGPPLSAPAARPAAVPSPQPAPAPAMAEAPAMADGDLDLSGIDLDFDLDPRPAASADGPVGDGGAGGARRQEMATKLDLAAAYEEIGDREGARELLDEVVREGDGEQQQRARAMLGKLA